MTDPTITLHGGTGSQDGPLRPAERHVTIRATSGVGALRLLDVWSHRELVYFLAWRDIKVRYKQTSLGAAWAVIQPLALMGVLTLFVGHFLKADTGSDVPYAVFTFTALVPWTFFASSLNASSTSLITNSNLISKVYFPRLVLPIAAAGSFLIDFLISTLVLLVMMALYGIYPTVRLLAVPALVVLLLLAVFGVGVWFAAISARYRDVTYALPLLTQVWLFASPIAYSITVVPEEWRWLYSLNPMVGVIQGFRWVFLDQGGASVGFVALSACASLVLLLTGVVYFRKTERTFADVI